MLDMVVYGSGAAETSTSSSGFLVSSDYYTANVGDSISRKQISLSKGQSLDASTGSFILTIQDNGKNLILYPVNRAFDEKLLEVPEKLNSIKVSPSGTWLAGGTLESGNLYLWELASGNLMALIKTHKKSIDNIEFSRDESFVFTGLSDGSLLGWRFLQLITSTHERVGDIPPFFAWDKSHISGITGLCVGYGQCFDNRVYSGSADKTVRTWNMTSSRLAITYMVADKVTALAIDPAERSIYAGLENGEIVIIQRFKINPVTGLVEGPQDSGEHISIESTDTNTLLRPDFVASDNKSNKKCSVSSLSISFEGNAIVAGYSDGKVYSFATSTRQVLVQLPSQPGAVRGLQMIKNNERSFSIPQSLSSHILLKDLDYSVWVKIEEPRQMELFSGMEKVQINAGFFATSSDSLLHSQLHKLKDEISRVESCRSELDTMHKQLWTLHSQEKKNVNTIHK